MYYKVLLNERIRVEPKLFKEKVEETITSAILEQYEGLLTENQGILVSFISIQSVGEGLIIPGDGAVHYDTNFQMLCWKPNVQEIIEGKIGEITEFGAFVKMGPIDGLVHLSQVMDDFVSFSKAGGLLGRDSKRSLKSGDNVLARIIATSMKNLSTAKIGLTMRQDGLGRSEWYEEKKVITPSKKKTDKKESKKPKGGKK